MNKTFKILMVLLLALLAVAPGNAQTPDAPQFTFYTSYYNAVACANMQILFPNFASKTCSQYVLVFLFSPVVEVTVFQVAVNYVRSDGTSAAQTAFVQKLADGTGYAAFSNDVTNITIQGVSVTPLKSAGATLTAGVVAQ
jgi:hypothetical protein